MSGSSTAPIALFVYNRPLHTEKTVQALKTNVGAAESELFVFSDGPASQSAVESVNAVRTFIRTIDSFKAVHIIERAENFGLAKSIMSGVSQLCASHGRVIVLEDDLVTSPYFLKFMNDALELYAHTPEVLHVSGSTYPIRHNLKSTSFFLHVPLCWGWATWDRAWKSFSRDFSLMERFDKKMIRRFNFENTHPYWQQLELNKSGKLNTWFVFWYAILFLQKRLALFPSYSMIENIGWDGSGTHCDTSETYKVAAHTQPLKLEPIPLMESAEAYQAHVEFFSSLRVGLPRRILNKICRMLGIKNA